MEIAVLTDAVQRVFAGETLAGIKGVPQEQLEGAYERACDLVDGEDYDAALEPLMLLVTHDPYDFRFQFGYGLCLHQLGRAEDAAKHYGLAYMLDPHDPGCVFRLGECHAELGDAEAATEAFEAAISLCEPPAPNPEIRLAAEAALRQLHA
jgi:type III secretion system low calcium response chaperone LcrH/SycD